MWGINIHVVKQCYTYVCGIYYALRWKKYTFICVVNNKTSVTAFGRVGEWVGNTNMQ